MQAHSCPQVLQKRAPNHPQVGQRKQCVQLRRVLGQSPVAHLHMSELALDHPERVFDLGSDARLGFLQRFHDRAHGRVLVQHLAMAGHHGHVPVDLAMVFDHFIALVNTPVAGVGEDIGFVAVQQFAGLGDVVRVGRCCLDGVHQARVGIDTNMNTKGLSASR